MDMQLWHAEWTCKMGLNDDKQTCSWSHGMESWHEAWTWSTDIRDCWHAEWTTKMDMQHEQAACSCSYFLFDVHFHLCSFFVHVHVHEICSCSMFTQQVFVPHVHTTCSCNMFMQRGHAARRHGHAASTWACITDLGTQHGHGHTSWT
jgi:hypothetical protein